MNILALKIVAAILGAAFKPWVDTFSLHFLLGQAQ